MMLVQTIAIDRAGVQSLYFASKNLIGQLGALDDGLCPDRYFRWHRYDYTQ